MHAEHRPLNAEFPEKREQLQRLRQDSPSFARKADEYEALDNRICAAEALSDDVLNVLKQERLTLKDEIARDLKHAAGSCCGGGCGG